MPPTRVYCRVLGPAGITVDGREAPSELLWRKHLALLVYLARSPRRARTREHLLGLLWSDRDEARARHSLSEALRVLRRVLGDDAVQADVDQVRLEHPGLVLDCDELAACGTRADWEGAAALVEGEFLEGLLIADASAFEDWLAAERAAWRAQSLDALVRCAEARLARGDAAAAVPAAQRAVRLDPTAEPAVRIAMRAHALAGDRSAALRVAAELERALYEQLGARPAAETVRLVERIREARAGRRVPAAPPAAGPRPPLLGRARALATLVGAWERAKGGRAQVVVVEGEPGEGNTRLVDELVSRARLDEATVAATRAVPADEAQPWSGVTGLLAAGLAEAPGLTGAPAGALAALGTLYPDLAARPTGAALPVPDAVSAAVAAAAEERPVLLALDDVQWLDRDTLALLPGLARDLASRPVLLLLAAARGAPGDARLDELRARLGRDVEGETVRLGRLDSAALRELARWALPRYPDDQLERVTRRVERDSAGIPLLAVAMLAAVAQGFKLTSEAPTWPAPKHTLVDTLPGDLPAAAVGSVCLRFSKLEPAARDVLGAAAALGDRVAPEQLARATGLDGTAVERALDLLEWDRWLVADARGYAFAAPIARQIVLQEMITPGQARRYRQRASA